MRNTLFYGDNLEILRRYVQNDTVDLVYLDPPFNSARDYNVIFKEQSGEPAQAQMKAFTDTWAWSEHAYDIFMTESHKPVLTDMMEGFVKMIGRNALTAYLVNMTPRLIELHRVLKPTGSLYLHCDPTASHYLKIILDMLFGPKNFRNEIVWKRQSAHSDARLKFSDVADILLFYVKSNQALFKPQYTTHDPNYITKFYRFNDNDGKGSYSLDNMASPNPRPNLMYEWQGYPFPDKGWRYQKETMQKLHDEGRIWYPCNTDGTFDTSRRPRLKRYLNEQEGSIVTNIWADIQPLHDVAAERLGYPTQKPLVLLERIIQASSNEGDVVLDPFCGCGTAVVAAQKLKRQWMGIDVTALAVSLIKARMLDSFKLDPKKDYDVVGEPTTASDAAALALHDRDEFQRWAISLVPRARPYQDKKGADTGIDGVLLFKGFEKDFKKILIQVKSGHVQSGQIRDFRGTVEREKATLGFFICLENPTKPMLLEADTAGFYTFGSRKFARLQIRTIDQLLKGNPFELPQSTDLLGIQQAQRIEEDLQSGLDFDE